MKKVCFCLLLALVVAAPAANAQDQYVELLRQDLRTAKVEIVTEGMALTEAEGKVFWPIYREYDLELSKLWDTRLELIKEYAENYQSMDEATADSIMKRALEGRERRAKLHTKYYQKFRKEVGAILAARFMQIDGIIQNLVDLQISAELPLVVEPAAPAAEGR